MIDDGGLEAQRVELAAEPDFDLGPVRVRPSRRQIHVGGATRDLEPRVMQVLVALARVEGEVVSRDRLNDLCWNGRIVGDDAINRCILALRRLARSIDPLPFEIETVPRVGYILTRPAACVADTLPPFPCAVLPKSVAVLPFANLTGDPAKEYLGDGMAEELITTLSRGHELKVPARTSTFSYKGRNQDIRDIAQELGVSAVLEGSVRAADDRIRVTAQLIDAQSGFHLWSQNYDRRMSDLFAVQDEISARIAQILEAKLRPGPAHVPDPQAYALFLQGRAILMRGTPDSFGLAISLQEQAIAIDPHFARPWADLAGALHVATIMGLLPPTRQAEARERAEQARRLDPSYGPSYTVLAGLDLAAGDWLSAEAGFCAAIEIDADEPMARSSMALHLLAQVGQLRRGVELAEGAVRLAPADVNTRLYCAYLANSRGEKESRNAHLETAFQLGLSKERAEVRLLLAKIAYDRGRFDEAGDEVLAFFQMMVCLLGAGQRDIVRPVYSALAGTADPSTAIRAIEEFVAATDRDDGLWRFPILAGVLMQWQVLLGAVTDALDLAGRLIASWRRSGHLAYTNIGSFWLSHMRPFRRHPHFQHLVEQLGMPAYWDRHGPPDGYELKRGCLVEIDE